MAYTRRNMTTAAIILSLVKLAYTRVKNSTCITRSVIAYASVAYILRGPCADCVATEYFNDHYFAYDASLSYD